MLKVHGFPTVSLFSLLALFFLSPVAPQAASGPYFNTYTHHVEDGEWELAFGADYVWPQEGPGASGYAVEVEHGFGGQFMGALYLLGTKEAGDSARLDGFKVEGLWNPWSVNRFWTPTLYLEYEHFLHEPTYRTAILGSVEEEKPEGEEEGTEKEFEARLIFSKDFSKGNFAVNLIAEKNLHGGAVEFGYTAGVYLIGPQVGSGSFDTGRPWDSRLLYGFEVVGGLGESGDFRFSAHQQKHAFQPFLSLPVGAGNFVKVAYQAAISSGTENKVRVMLVMHL